MKLFVAAAVAVVAAACTETPTTPSVWSEVEIRDQLVMANLNHPTTGARGRLTRWRVPIAVNTNNIARAELALQRVEQWSSGAIRFTRVGGTPANGLVFVEGGAAAADTSAGCSELSGQPPGVTGRSFALQWDAGSAIGGSYTLRLGSDRCDDARAGRYPSAYAEHVLTHALGIFEHFPGYTGPEGLVDAHAFAVLYNLYANPIGAAPQDLRMWPPAPR